MFVPASGWNKVETHIQGLQNQLCFGVSHISAQSLLLRWEELLEKYPYLSCLSTKACVYARWSQSELAFSACTMIYTARQMGDEGKNKRSSSLFMWSLYIVSLDIWSTWQDSAPVAWVTKGSTNFFLYFSFLSQMLQLTFSPPGESRTFTRLKNKPVTHWWTMRAVWMSWMSWKSPSCSSLSFCIPPWPWSYCSTEEEPTLYIITCPILGLWLKYSADCFIFLPTDLVGRSIGWSFLNAINLMSERPHTNGVVSNWFGVILA